MIKFQRGYSSADILFRSLSNGGVESQMRDAINIPLKHNQMSKKKFKSYRSYLQRLSLGVQSYLRSSSLEKQIELDAKLRNYNEYRRLHGKQISRFSRRYFINTDFPNAEPHLKSVAEKLYLFIKTEAKVSEAMADVKNLWAKRPRVDYTRREKELDYLRNYYSYSPVREEVLLTFHEKLNSIANNVGFSTYADLQFGSRSASLFGCHDDAKAFLKSCFLEMEPLLLKDYYDLKRWKGSNGAYKRHKSSVYPECVHHHRRWAQVSMWSNKNINIINSVVPGDLFLCLRKFCELSMGITFDLEPLKRFELPDSTDIKLKVHDLDDKKDIGYIYILKADPSKSLSSYASDVYLKTTSELPVVRMNLKATRNRRWYFSEAKTAIHEFGHCLHYLLHSKGNALTLSPPQIYNPDVAEIPSTLFEMLIFHPLFIENIRDPVGASTENNAKFSYFDTMLDYSALEMSDLIHQYSLILEFFSRQKLDTTMDILKDSKLLSVLDSFEDSARHQYDLQRNMLSYKSHMYGYVAGQAVANIIFFSLFDRNPFDSNSGRKLKKFLSADWTSGIYLLISDLVGRNVEPQSLPRALANPYFHKRKAFDVHLPASCLP